MNEKENLNNKEIEENDEVNEYDNEEDFGEELTELLSNESETLDIIDSIYRNGMRETLEAFCNGKLNEIGSWYFDSDTSRIEGEISKSISQLKNTKDELTETTEQLIKLCLKNDLKIKVTLDDIDITKFLNIQYFIKDILKPEETCKKEKIELFSILKEQVSIISNYDATCSNGIDDFLRKNNYIDDIYEKLLNIFNKLKVYYDEGLLPINLDRFFIDEWKKSNQKN